MGGFGTSYSAFDRFQQRHRFERMTRSNASRPAAV
jgi:hypothetical protein